MVEIWIQGRQKTTSPPLPWEALKCVKLSSKMCCSPGGGKGVSLRLCLATAMHFPQEKERGRSSRTPVLITVLSTGAEGMQEAEGAPFLTWASSP